MHLPFFVYGSLKPGEANYARYLAGNVLREEIAWLPGAALYTPGPYPFLLLAPPSSPSNEQVHGVLITITPTVYRRILAQLDHLENYSLGRANNLYERVALDVQSAAGSVRAWVYVAGAHARAAISNGTMHKVPGGVWGNA